MLNSKIPQMKTIKQCFDEIKKIDPDSVISQWFIRNLCRDNLVKHFMSGKKILVNFDDLIFYLNNSGTSKDLDLYRKMKCDTFNNSQIIQEEVLHG